VIDMNLLQRGCEPHAFETIDEKDLEPSHQRGGLRVNRVAMATYFEHGCI